MERIIRDSDRLRCDPRSVGPCAKPGDIEHLVDRGNSQSAGKRAQLRSQPGRCRRAQASTVISRKQLCCLLPRITTRCCSPNPMGRPTRVERLAINPNRSSSRTMRIHEYTSQASINETIGLKQIADAKVASATAARASAELEVARRGLVSTVVTLYYQVSAAEKKQRSIRSGASGSRKHSPA